MIKLRAHHLLCIKFYEGKGYSKEFVENMDKITDELKKNPNKEVLLLNKCDDLCECCPHKTENNTCESGQKVNMLDSGVLLNFKLTPYKTYSYKELKDNVDKNLTKEVFENICSTCEWYKAGVCTP